MGALVASFFNPYYYVYAGLPGLLTIINAYNPDFPMSIVGEVIGNAIALCLPIIVLMLTGYGDDSTKAQDKPFLNDQVQEKISRKREQLDKSLKHQ